jgi:hypothetical protein
MLSIAAPPPDALVAWGIGVLSILVVVAWAHIWSRGHRPLRRALIIAACAVMSVSALAARLGLLQRFDVTPPPMALLILFVLAGGVAGGLSRLGGTVAGTVPLGALVGLQSFRLPLELLMHRGAVRGIVPPELSYGGFNYDILTGLGALALAAALRGGAAVPRWLLWTWNLWGAWCLVVIAAVAITSSPMVRLFGDDPRHLNTWVLFFPYVWVPVVLVTIAIASHIVITRALLKRP